MWITNDIMRWDCSRHDAVHRASDDRPQTGRHETFVLTEMDKACAIMCRIPASEPATCSNAVSSQFNEYQVNGNRRRSCVAQDTRWVHYYVVETHISDQHEKESETSPP